MSFLNPEAIRDWCKKTFLKESNVLKTIDDVELNEEEGKSVDALVVKEVFRSVSDGKKEIASAITDKGVTTDATDTFAVMAKNIGKIEGGGSVEEHGSFIFNYIMQCGFTSVTGFNNQINNFEGKKVKKVIFHSFTIIGRKIASTYTNKTLYLVVSARNEETSTIKSKTVASVICSSTTNATKTVTEEVVSLEDDFPEMEGITEIRLYSTTASGTYQYYYGSANGNIEIFY